MDHFNQTHASDYYTGTQSNLLHNRGPERSSVHIMSTNGTGYTPISKPTSRPRNESWKTTNNNTTTTTTTTTTESWKMSGKPRHAQLHYLQDDPRNRRQSAPLFNSPKPLPQEPTPVIQSEPFNLIYPPGIHDQYTTQAPFHLNTPVQQHAPYYSHNEIYSPAPFNQPYPPVHDFVPPPLVDYQHYHHHHHHQPHQDYPPVISNHTNFSPLPTPESLPPLPPPPTTQIVQETPKSTNVPPKTDEKSKEKNKDAKLEKKIRQITVQSINIEHRVWIDVLPSETGLSLAEKIHIIATFRTRKIVSITTASGRKIPLDNRPVFGSWMDMEKFEDGERWTVEWRENDRGVVDRFMAKIVQSKRKD